MPQQYEVFDDHACALGEGPLWHPDRQTLLWFDIDNKVLFEKSESGSRVEYRFDRSVSAAGLVSGSDSRLVIASQRDLFLFDLDRRHEESLVSMEADNAATRSNDGRADPQGGFWIGTMGFKAEPQAGSIYRFYRGELRKLFSGTTIPNSICFSPCGSVAYFADSEQGTIWKVSLDKEGWPVGDREIFLQLESDALAPDGAVCDSAGNLWSAQWMGACVSVYDRQGQPINRHHLPTSQITCPAFGGPDCTTLYVTSAGAHLPEHMQGTQPLAGCTFKIESAGVSGKPEARVRL